MCYICERNGTVGDHYRDALKTIRAALKVWGRKRQVYGEEIQIASPVLAEGWRQWEGHHCIPNTVKTEWVSAPRVGRVWTAKDFEKWQAAHRLSPLPGATDRPALAFTFTPVPRVHRL